MSTSTSHSSGESTTRYAPYVEDAHKDLLDDVQGWVSSAASDNPYSDTEDEDFDGQPNWAFLGYGYTVRDFPTLYDMYGKFVAGLNIEGIWSELYSDTMDGTITNALVTAERALLQDAIDEDSIPRLMAGMRDINSVNSSTFVVGKAILEDTRNKEIAKFSAELKYRLLPLVHDRYKTHLSWNSGVIGTYIDVMRAYFATKQAYTELHYNLRDKRGRWKLEMSDYQRAAVGTLQGAMKTSTSESAQHFAAAPTGSSGGMAAGGGGSTSSVGGAIGTAMTGAAIGGMIGGPIGAAAGGLLGLVGGFLF